MSRFAALLTIVLIGGCTEAPSDGPRGSANAAGADDRPAIRMANPHDDQLRALPPHLQRLAMMRAVRDTGNACQRVDNAGYQQDYQNLRMWVAVCGAENKRWAVFIAPNGDVQVRDCADAGQLSLPRCEDPPPAVPDSSAPTVREGAADNAFRNQF